MAERRPAISSSRKIYTYSGLQYTGSAQRQGADRLVVISPGLVALHRACGGALGNAIRHHNPRAFPRRTREPGDLQLTCLAVEQKPGDSVAPGAVRQPSGLVSGRLSTRDK